MNKIISYLLFIWGPLVGCDGNGPATVDFEIASATIIGRETCSADTSLNAWLIDLGQTTSGKTSRVYYGKEAIVNGKSYAHVVKTYTPLVSRLDSTRQYVFFFYVEDVLPSPSCDLPNPIPINVPQIRVKDVSFKAP